MVVIALINGKPTIYSDDGADVARAAEVVDLAQQALTPAVAV